MAGDVVKPLGFSELTAARPLRHGKHLANLIAGDTKSLRDAALRVAVTAEAPDGLGLGLSCP